MCPAASSDMLSSLFQHIYIYVNANYMQSGSFKDKAFGCMCIADSCSLHLALRVVVALCLPVLSKLFSNLVYFGFVEPSL